MIYDWRLSLSQTAPAGGIQRWSDMGVFARMMEGLASEAADRKTVMIDATYLKAHRTASSLRLKKGGVAG